MSRKTDERDNASVPTQPVLAVIRFKLREQIAEKMFREGRKVTIIEVAEATGIARSVLSGLVNQRGYNTVTDNLDRLCAYFGCELGGLVEYVADPPVAPIKGKAMRRAKRDQSRR
jgi:DNA-binding Xre family transcriptional regulator